MGKGTFSCMSVDTKTQALDKLDAEIKSKVEITNEYSFLAKNLSA